MARRLDHRLLEQQPPKRKLSINSITKTSQKQKQKQISVCITDPIKPSRISSIKAIQTVILWILTEDQTNPMWINIKNKVATKHILTIFIETEGDILQKMVEQGTLENLKQHWTGKTKTTHRYEDINISNEEPWYRMFSNLPIPRKIPKVVESRENFNDHIYETYKAYSLSQQQLKNNLYPRQGTLTVDFIRTSAYNQLITDDMVSLILGMDCEMLSTVQGFQLAKITIINFRFQKIYQKLVKPQNKIVDYNTKFSGITEDLLRNVTTTLENIQQDLKKIIFKNTILVGHSLQNDLRSIRFIHELVVDTSVLFRSEQGQKISLKNLVSTYFKNNIQIGSHDSYEDALNAMALAKLKIQILDKINTQGSAEDIKFSILDQILKSDNEQPLVITCLPEECKLLKKHKVEVIQLDKPSITSWSNQIKWYFKRNHPGKAIFLSMRRSGVQSWQRYYEGMDRWIGQFGVDLPKSSLVILNFQLQSNSRNSNFKPFSVFVVI